MNLGVYSHLSSEERYVIIYLVLNDLSLRKVARQLNRHHTRYCQLSKVLISREEPIGGRDFILRRLRLRKKPGFRPASCNPLSGQFFLQQLTDQFRIGVAAGGPHGLTDQKPDRLLIALVIIFNRRGIFGQHPGHDAFQRSGV